MKTFNAPTEPNAERNAPTDLRARRIVLGIGDPDHDAAAIAWAIAEARPGIDAVHIVHAFSTLRLDGSSWGPVTDARETDRLHASRVISQVEQRLRYASPGLLVDGSAVTGVGWEVLREFSGLVDVVIVGEDEARPGAFTAVHLAHLAQCPVATVPVDWRIDMRRPRSPVTVLLDTADLDQSLLSYGFAAADARSTGVQVIQYWSSLHEAGPRTAQLIANRQERLDMQLEDWRRRHPHIGVVAELRLSDDPETVADLRVQSQLLIASSSSAHLFHPTVPRLAGRCPVITIPLTRN